MIATDVPPTVERPDRPEERLAKLPLAALIVVVAAVRWGVAANRRVFSIWFDEPVQLAIGRSLGGGTQWNLFDVATWQPGFGILIAPIFALVDDPTTAFRLVLGTNAILGGLSAGVLAVIVARVTNLGSTASLVTAGCVALMPTSLFASAHSWAEPMVSLTFLVGVYLLLRFVDAPSSALGLSAIVTAAAGALAHGRMLPMLATTTIIVVSVWAGRRRYVDAGINLVVAGVSTVAVLAVSRAVTGRLWDEPDGTNSVGEVLGHLRHPIAIAERTIGQAWYQLVATAGLFGFGLVAVTIGATGRYRPTIATPARRHAIVIGATFLPMMALSILFMAGHDRRVDFLIYGRYNDAVAWVLVALGVAALFELIRHSARSWIIWTAGVGIAIAVCGASIHLAYGRTLRGGAAEPDMIPGLVAITGSRTIDAVVPSLVAAAALTTFVVVARCFSNPRLAIAALAVAGILVGGLRMDRVVRPRANDLAIASAVQEIEQLVPSGSTVGFRFVPGAESQLLSPLTQNIRLQMYQFYLHDYRIAADHGFDDDVGPYVFAPSLHEDYVRSDAVLLWADPDVPLGLWLEPDGQ